MNEPGLQESISMVLRSGGSRGRQPTNFGIQDRPYLIVYFRDPEGDILELEQSANYEKAAI
ncbi:hypothetical protein [Sulfitobacter sp. DFL-23]|uniref:hypothetical protein n=1 Tax=Roseobacteraceae TaxID=2854170 RepID=UPI0019640267|nr:hypothetical protein [Sulfitobacter sp. DFL-23]